MTEIQPCIFEELVKRITNSSGLAEGREIVDHKRKDDYSVKAFFVKWPQFEVSIVCGIDPSIQCSFFYGANYYSRDHLSPENEGLVNLLQHWKQGLFNKHLIRATTVDMIIVKKKENEIFKWPNCELEVAWETIYNTILKKP